MKKKWAQVRFKKCDQQNVLEIIYLVYMNKKGFWQLNNFTMVDMP